MSVFDDQQSETVERSFVRPLRAQHSIAKYFSVVERQR